MTVAELTRYALDGWELRAPRGCRWRIHNRAWQALEGGKWRRSYVAPNIKPTWSACRRISTPLKVVDDELWPAIPETATTYLHYTITPDGQVSDPEFKQEDT
jgi:hypothetical protein